MKAEDKINIMLEEYKSLRAEILTRINHRMAFLGLTITLIGVGLLKRDLSMPQGILVCAAILMLLIIWARIGYLIARLGKRISEIEEDINTLAKDELLCWEGKAMEGEIFRQIFPIKSTGCARKQK